MEVDGEEISLAKLKERVTREEVLLHLKSVDAAKEQSNFPVASKYLREALKGIKDELQEDPKLQLEWTHVYAAVHQKKAQGLMSIDALDIALTTVGQLDKHGGGNVLERSPELALRHHILRSRSLDIMTGALEGQDNLLLSALDDNKRQRLTSVCGSSVDASQEKIVSQLMTRSFTSLQGAIKAAKSTEARSNGQQSDGSCMIQAMMAMVGFCDRALRRKEEDAENAPEIDIKLFPGIVVRYVLKAMAYGSEEARKRFPRLLQLVEIYPDTLDAFAKKAGGVPCWMFIGWTNQMVALMDKHEGRAVHGIVEEIAANYPQALCYAFKISSESFVFDESKESKLNQESVNRVKRKLELPLVDDFIAALELLHNPEMVFKDWCEGDMKLILEDKDKRTKLTAIKEAFAKMYSQLFESHGNRRAGSPSQTPASEHGPHRKRFSKEFCAQIEKAFGKNGEKLKGISMKNFNELCKVFREKMAPKKHPPGNLKEYSPWLTNFQASNFAQTLEVPGQYTGQSKPLPEYHVKIAGFDEKVLVLTSIRRPKRITIRGDDEKDYMFLVKGGEDLRLDQRIEQLFYMMNEIMAEDATCSKRHLRLRTYQVIPMTPRVGLIEWMMHTKPLKEFIYSAVAGTEENQMRTIPALQMEWLKKFGCEPGKDLRRSYGCMYSKASRTETETAFMQRQARVPWDLLRQAFDQMSASPEAYLTLRSHFARTHACVSICQYLLGIGDRHLSNFMVDMETGGMVGIDFGHSFGSATQFLPIPELMPFRLTRQITNFLLPLKESGLLRLTMIYVLRALRANHELLLNTMDVFVKEPSLDWQAFARKQAAVQGVKPGEEEDLAWYPREKINTARKKLEGANPAYITRSNLQLGHSKMPWMKDMISVCLGDRRVNPRARHPETGLSVEEQVDCLIDQATDPNILGRTYQGWEPWV